jgi:flagellar basal body-associated protein FliL
VNTTQVTTETTPQKPDKTTTESSKNSAFVYVVVIILIVIIIIFAIALIWFCFINSKSLFFLNSTEKSKKFPKNIFQSRRSLCLKPKESMEALERKM